jgi:hypothetical protein
MLYVKTAEEKNAKGKGRGYFFLDYYLHIHHRLHGYYHRQEDIEEYSYLSSFRPYSHIAVRPLCCKQTLARWLYANYPILAD